MDGEFAGKYIWLLCTIILFFLEVMLNGFFCTCSFRSVNVARAGLPVLLLNIWLTNAIDGGLLFAGRMASHLLRVDTGYNGTSELIHSEDRGFKDSWLITLHLGIPLKIATHSISNLLGLAICVDVGFLSGVRPPVGGSAQKAVMNQRRAVDYVGLSWIIAVFLMLHPLVLSFVDTTAFLVVLYTWAIYMGFATIIILILILSICCRRQVRRSPFTKRCCERVGRGMTHEKGRSGQEGPEEEEEDKEEADEEHMDMLEVSDSDSCVRSRLQHRTKATSILLQLVLLLAMMLPWPLFETLHLHRSTRDTVVKNLKRQFGSKTDFGLFYQFLRLLPLAFYLIQPACLLMFKEVRERLPFGKAKMRRSVKIGQTRAQFKPLARDYESARDQGEMSEIESVL